MERTERLKELFTTSSLNNLFTIRKIDEYKNFSSIRLVSNKFRIRGLELWDGNGSPYIRVYHGTSIPETIKSEIDSIDGHLKSTPSWTDTQGDQLQICTELFNIFSSESAIEIADQNKIYTRNSAYEGLALPDVDTSETEVLGMEFSWKELIAISEDCSENNQLKVSLSKSGVYLQRSKDGLARYVGSASGEGGILSRWLKHLTSNGDAKHLNLYVLENGYNNLIFTVLEFTSPETAVSIEQRWKLTLATKNTGPYDGFRLNRN